MTTWTWFTLKMHKINKGCYFLCSSNQSSIKAQVPKKGYESVVFFSVKISVC